MSTSTSGKKEKFARFGIFMKGFVYFLMGLLTALAAFNMGGEKSGSTNVLQFVAQQSFGKILLTIVAAGLIGYVFWRLYQAITDQNNDGNDTKAIAKRFGYAGSGLIYAFLAYSAVKLIIGASSKSGGSGSMTETLMDKPYGQILVGILGLILLGNGAFQFYRAYSKKFWNKINESEMGAKRKKLLINSGIVGFGSRGIVNCILAYLLLRAAWEANVSASGGKVKAFSFIKDAFGTTVLGIIALGMVCYGIFMFLQALYRKMDMN